MRSLLAGLLGVILAAVSLRAEGVPDIRAIAAVGPDSAAAPASDWVRAELAPLISENLAAYGAADIGTLIALLEARAAGVSVHPSTGVYLVYPSRRGVLLMRADQLPNASFFIDFQKGAHLLMLRSRSASTWARKTQTVQTRDVLEALKYLLSLRRP